MMPSKNNYPFYVVMEQTTPVGAKAEIIDEHKGSNGEVNFIRFRQCLQSFGHRNRNKRLWKRWHIEKSLEHPWVQDYIKNRGGLPGENGHPISMVDGQKLSMERLVTIDPNNTCILLKSYEFQGEDLLFGEIETIDDGNGPGDRLKRYILQGCDPAVSCRSLVPQQKNPDGTIDVTGAGRLICYDRVIMPSHEEAFSDQKAPMKNVTKQFKMSPVYESALADTDFAKWAMEHSDHAKFVLDGLTPAMESALLDIDGMFSVNTEEGRTFIPLSRDKKIMDEIKSFMTGR